MCTDHAETLVLCAGCRVGVCVTNADSPSGCMLWNPMIESPQFVFLCPYCSIRAKRPCLVRLDGSQGMCTKTPNPGPLQLRRREETKALDAHTVYYRYDPPVLIVAITWHDTKGFGRFLYDRLALAYRTNEDAVSTYPSSQRTTVLTASTALMDGYHHRR